MTHVLPKLRKNNFWHVWNCSKCGGELTTQHRRSSAGKTIPIACYLCGKSQPLSIPIPGNTGFTLNTDKPSFKRDSTSPIDFIKNESYCVCFVNTTKSPDKVVRMPHYTYDVRDGDVYFHQLVEETYYLETAGQAIAYKLLNWYDVDIKRHCQQALINQIDAMSAIREFISTTETSD